MGCYVNQGVYPVHALPHGGGNERDPTTRRRPHALKGGGQLALDFSGAPQREVRVVGVGPDRIGVADEPVWPVRPAEDRSRQADQLRVLGGRHAGAVGCEPCDDLDRLLGGARSGQRPAQPGRGIGGGARLGSRRIGVVPVVIVVVGGDVALAEPSSCTRVTRAIAAAADAAQQSFGFREAQVSHGVYGRTTNGLTRLTLVTTRKKFLETVVARLAIALVK